MDTKITAISILVASILIGGAIILYSVNKNQNIEAEIAGNNVAVVNGRQIITINAKGGYWPRMTSAKADMPTVIKMNTRGTFDCSSALNIPSLGINKYLPPTGETEIEIPPQKAGTSVRGLCAMGMYNFLVNFN